MPADFPLWRLRPEEAARLIILDPLRPVERHKFWRKREMRIRPSHRSAPRNDDMQRLALAKLDHKGNLNSYWRQAFAEHADEFPVVLLIGPLMQDGRFYTYRPDRVANPLGFERERPPFEGIYSRAQFEADEAYFEAARALNRENFILGQQGEGPRVDGLIYMRIDNLLLAEIAHCKARLQMTWVILEASRKAKQTDKPRKSKKPEVWHNIGKNHDAAVGFKQSGYKVTWDGLKYMVRMSGG